MDYFLETSIAGPSNLLFLRRDNEAAIEHCRASGVNSCSRAKPSRHDRTFVDK